ncbi:MAG: DUF3536 domain-containing protein, partial [Candidatus Eisenbacteria bacterium]|nr:DUF3536 domain-containing protein [Candidatus Eisenbacteria bacterium]
MKRYRRLRDHGMDRRICIHGHFYQPPRENPWLGSVEFQASAVTHHDWNERITSEAYWPNGAARIYNDDMSQAQVVNNYAHMSFNFGPTLLSWMATEARPCYELILEADRISRRLFDGHGSAMAQAYNHMIMPLANSRDKFTQIYWGIRDFEYRFGRSPRGMWLGETAVDLETLDIMASQGIQFTVLAPGQAARVRPLNQPLWRELKGTGIDPRQPYVQKLPSGRNITIFFYDGPLSQGVAFESLLNRGETFAHRLMEGFTESSLPQLTHIATDGETYGHHHRFGEMALARALWYLEEQGLTSVSNYSQFMDLYPPTHAVEIREDSSWSCFHGVERWRSDCGCQTGGDPHWNQAWREPLREALDWLRDHMAAMFEADREGWFEDPWRARNDFIEVILEEVTPLGFMRDQEKRDLSDQEREQALKALEAQRLAMFMFTSCGWFFNDLDGIETHQILLYAARAIELAEEVYGVSLEEEFLERLERAQSNVETAGSGREIYTRVVHEARVTAIDLARHGGFALDADQYRSLEFPTEAIRIRDDDVSHGDAGKLWLGRIEVISRLTGET